ncbi:hypothetical protein A2955_01965 [Candidatus Woesebacteria bacterium RIFCSPLOWO2_01_FULL_37_19]|uniref:Glycosyltransferase 2-like domain-containing protein n=1 Tax=Candidatus Woesebacteria bacterium RIFCSPLOWO2_01_FULL_37_19 TaxID=1802514 RepID=A0A1F8B034_9BACT|nr:MAG: hypothetical protein A2955_01965 [Candidatus Woesebacteria bacterium RIFCSPLOWO2_01_FULL_37_19]
MVKKSMEKLAIVTVDFNRHDDTLELLDSGRRLKTSGLDVRWFLVDNGSDEYVGKHITPELDNVELLQTGENKGFAGGYNFGIKYALNWGAEYILVINNDAILADEDLLIKLVWLLKRKKDIVAVSPKIYFAPGYEFHKDRYDKKNIGKVIWWAGSKFDWDNINLIHRGLDEVDDGKYNEIEESDFLSGCCFLIKRQGFEKSGFFNEKLFAYFEDDELMLRLKKAGFRLFYDGKTYIYHKVSRTSGIGSPQTDYLITRNRLYFGMKYASLRTKIALIKESARFLLAGRSAQRMGVRDFFLGRYGPPEKALAKPKVSYPVELSIVIINYKTSGLTLRLIESIYENSGLSNDDYEIVVLDNASEEELGERISKRFPKVKFIQNKVNVGFAKGVNNAIDFTRGRYILLLNSDIEVNKEAIKNILDTADKFEEQAVIAGKLILPDGTIQNSCYKIPTLLGAIREYLLGRKNDYSLFSPNADKAVRVEGSVMACLLIPRKILNMVGKLSEEYFMYYEDIEFCSRLKKVEVPLIYDSGALFKHQHGASSKVFGDNKSKELLKNSAKIYHGRIKYWFLTAILWLGQKMKRLS